MELVSPNTTRLLSAASVQRFGLLIRYNVQLYLDLYSFFIQNNYSQILAYYNNSVENPDTASFQFLDQLLDESQKISSLIRANRNSFSRVDDWETLDLLEDLRNKLKTIKNSDRWTRSSRTQNSWRSAIIQTTHTLATGQTLEDVSGDIYGESTRQNDWVRIALENDLAEADYTAEGGQAVKITKRMLSTPNFFLFSVVDNLVDEKLYGLDIYRQIMFTDNDLQVLSHKATAVQAIEILMQLKKGDIPEMPTLGSDPALTVGANISRLVYSSVVRQLEETFASDDTLRNFRVTKISYKSGAMELEYEVDTLYNLTYSNKNKFNV